jgi:hypothetical protein
MTAAACVGRVGGLAVALGIGAAMATGGLGVAWADGGDSAPSHASRGGAAPSARHSAASRPASKPKAPAAAAERAAVQADSRQAVTALRRVVRSVMTPLPDSTPAGPVDSPVSWVVFAATRRQVRPAQVAPQVTAAAAVNNQAPVVGSVNLATPNASTGRGHRNGQRQRPERRQTRLQGDDLRQGRGKHHHRGSIHLHPHRDGTAQRIHGHRRHRADHRHRDRRHR